MRKQHSAVAARCDSPLRCPPAVHERRHYCQRRRPRAVCAKAGRRLGGCRGLTPIFNQPIHGKRLWTGSASGVACRVVCALKACARSLPLRSGGRGCSLTLAKAMLGGPVLSFGSGRGGGMTTGAHLGRWLLLTLPCCLSRFFSAHTHTHAHTHAHTHSRTPLHNAQGGGGGRCCGLGAAGAAGRGRAGEPLAEAEGVRGPSHGCSGRGTEAGKDMARGEVEAVCARVCVWLRLSVRERRERRRRKKKRPSLSFVVGIAFGLGPPRLMCYGQSGGIQCRTIGTNSKHKDSFHPLLPFPPSPRLTAADPLFLTALPSPRRSRRRLPRQGS